MKNLLPILLLIAFCISTAVNAQQTFPQNGVYDEREGLFAFTNAVIYQSYNQKLDKATISKATIARKYQTGSVALQGKAYRYEGRLLPLLLLVSPWRRLEDVSNMICITKNGANQ